MAKPLVDFNVDLGPMYEAVGVMAGITAAVHSDIYVDYFSKYAADKFRYHFNTDFTTIAQTRPKQYHHVFEWGANGPATKIPLWRISVRGKGKQRMIGFTFLQSTRPVPLPPPPPDGPNIGSGSFKRHIFRFKATVMESGMPVTIKPKNSNGMLLIPVDFNARRYILTHKPVTVQNPGGSGTSGAFTQFWNAWFEGRAEGILKEQIIPMAESQINQTAVREMREIRRGRVSKTKQYSVFVQEGRKAQEKAEQAMISDAEKYYETSVDEAEIY